MLRISEEDRELIRKPHEFESSLVFEEHKDILTLIMEGSAPEKKQTLWFPELIKHLDELPHNEELFAATYYFVMKRQIKSDVYGYGLIHGFPYNEGVHNLNSFEHFFFTQEGYNRSKENALGGIYAHNRIKQDIPAGNWSMLASEYSGNFPFISKDINEYNPFIKALVQTSSNLETLVNLKMNIEIPELIKPGDDLMKFNFLGIFLYDKTISVSALGAWDSPTVVKYGN